MFWLIFPTEDIPRRVLTIAKKTEHPFGPITVAETPQLITPPLTTPSVLTISPDRFTKTNHQKDDGDQIAGRCRRNSTFAGVLATPEKRHRQRCSPRRKPSQPHLSLSLFLLLALYLTPMKKRLQRKMWPVF